MYHWNLSLKKKKKFIVKSIYQHAGWLKKKKKDRHATRNYNWTGNCFILGMKPFWWHIALIKISLQWAVLTELHKHNINRIRPERKCTKVMPVITSNNEPFCFDEGGGREKKNEQSTHRDTNSLTECSIILGFGQFKLYFFVSQYDRKIYITALLR